MMQQNDGLIVQINMLFVVLVVQEEYVMVLDEHIDI